MRRVHEFRPIHDAPGPRVVAVVVVEFFAPKSTVTVYLKRRLLYQVFFLLFTGMSEQPLPMSLPPSSTPSAVGNLGTNNSSRSDSRENFVVDQADSSSTFVHNREDFAPTSNTSSLMQQSEFASLSFFFH